MSAAENVMLGLLIVWTAIFAVIIAALLWQRKPKQQADRDPVANVPTPSGAPDFVPDEWVNQ